MRITAKRITVIGLGYVGYPLHEALKETDHEVYGYDPAKGYNDLPDSDVYIVCVPTPADAGQIDLSHVQTAFENIPSPGIVILESTVAPGITESLRGFLPEGSKVAYSPERISPGDTALKDAVKIVSAENQDTLDVVESLYQEIGLQTHTVSSIKVAEAVKVMENTQRDVNIALMNEFSEISRAHGIDPEEVFEGMRTKWNALPFKPGLVGGHCISVDPYYLAYSAQKAGVYPELTLSGRRVNSEVGERAAKNLVKEIGTDKTVLVLGYTYKKNVPDTRNTGVKTFVEELRGYGIDVRIFDPLAGYEIYEASDVSVLAVEHDELKSYSYTYKIEDLL